MWGRRDRVSSTIILVVWDGMMAASPMVMGKVGGDGALLEWKRRNSVLLSLSLRPFSGIQHQILAIHASCLQSLLS